MRASAKTTVKVQKTPTTEDDGILMTAVEGEDSGDFEEMTPSTSTHGVTESCHETEEEMQMTREVKQEVMSPTTVIERDPPTSSVRSLRQKLEHSLRIKSKDQVLAEQSRIRRISPKEPQFVSELFHAPTAMFSDETIVVLEPTDEEERREQKEQVDREKTWWTRSLRC